MKPKLLQLLGGSLLACGGVAVMVLVVFSPASKPAGGEVVGGATQRGRGGAVSRAHDREDGGSAGTGDRGKLLRGSSEADGARIPEALAAASEQDWQSPEKGALLRKVLADWACRDVNACAKWIQGLSQPLADQLARDVAGSLMSESALTSFLLLNELPPEPKNDEMMRQAAMEFATADLDAAKQWAESQPDAAASELLWSAVATVMSQNQPETAMAAALGRLTDPLVRDRVAVEIVQRWMQKDVQAAADYARNMPGDAGLAAARAVSGYWSGISPESCQSWIWSIPSPDLKASAFSAYVDNRILNDRPGMQRLQAEMADPGLREILESALRR